MSDEEPTPPADPWLTLVEIAEELRLSPATIRSWISKGTLRAMRAGQRKWVVRRSELDRMLRGEDFENIASLPPDPRPGASMDQRHRFPDSISPPSSSASWKPGSEDVNPEEWLGVAQWEWVAALQQSVMAPPDAWFAGRIRLIAEASARKAGAVGLFPEDEKMSWPSDPDAHALTLSHELRPGGNRPGPDDLWAEFDAAVARLASAMDDGGAGGLRRALEDVSLTMHELADALERYRGRYGNWQQRPPTGAVEPDGGDDAADPADATE